MTVRDVLKFLYWTVMPMAIGVLMFLYIDKTEASLLYKFLIFLVIAVPIATIRVFVGAKLFKEKQTLTEKIMSCDMRMKHGSSYCAECPDGYECASGTEKNVGKE